MSDGERNRRFERITNPTIIFPGIARRKMCTNKMHMAMLMETDGMLKVGHAMVVSSTMKVEFRTYVELNSWS